MSERMMHRSFVIWIKAGRWRISLASALAAVSGALLYRPDPDARTAAAFGAVLLVALGFTWFNQIQERRQDCLMSRTRNRPLAKKLISVRAALCWSGLCLCASLPLLYACGGWTALGIPSAAAFLYNGLYTRVKARSPLALFAGAAAGGAPPVLGWVCAGGPLLHKAPIALFLLFFVWQIPHFWLAAERFAPDYENAGFPVPWRIYGGYSWLLFLWLAAFCVMLLALPAFGILRSFGARAAIFGTAGFTLTGLCYPALRPGRLFHIVNLSMAAVCVTLVAESLCRG